MKKPDVPYTPEASPLEDRVISQKETNKAHEDRDAVILSWKRDLAILQNHRNMSRLTPEVASYVDGKIQMLEQCISQLRSLI